MTHAPGTLTERELTIVTRLTDGANTKQIAAELGVRSSAVCNTLFRIRARFGLAANNEQLIAILFRRGVLS
ncbi:MAG TPA: LuxR C-terminal-related transcriptional regulator [Candidatus Limnocylindria bacterium]